jgi:hypothetical protein
MLLALSGLAGDDGNHHEACVRMLSVRSDARSKIAPFLNRDVLNECPHHNSRRTAATAILVCMPVVTEANCDRDPDALPQPDALPKRRQHRSR